MSNFIQKPDLQHIPEKGTMYLEGQKSRRFFLPQTAPDLEGPFQSESSAQELGKVGASLLSFFSSEDRANISGNSKILSWQQFILTKF